MQRSHINTPSMHHRLNEDHYLSFSDKFLQNKVHKRVAFFVRCLSKTMAENRACTQHQYDHAIVDSFVYRNIGLCYSHFLTLLDGCNDCTMLKCNNCNIGFFIQRLAEEIAYNMLRYTQCSYASRTKKLPTSGLPHPYKQGDIARENIERALRKLQTHFTIRRSTQCHNVGTIDGTPVTAISIALGPVSVWNENTQSWKTCAYVQKEAELFTGAEQLDLMESAKRVVFAEYDEKPLMHQGQPVARRLPVFFAQQCGWTCEDKLLQMGAGEKHSSDNTAAQTLRRETSSTSVSALLPERFAQGWEASE